MYMHFTRNKTTQASMLTSEVKAVIDARCVEVGYLCTPKELHFDLTASNNPRLTVQETPWPVFQRYVYREKSKHKERTSTRTG